MSVRIDGIVSGSVADQLGFVAGDTLVKIDGHDINDVLDYRFYMVGRSFMTEGIGKNGEAFQKKVRKDEYEELGLLFDTYLMDKQLCCKNKCVFCFIDQLPDGLRDSLYFKDDDARLGFLFGNYITLTNLEDRDIDRILQMHISPVNISVHTMNPVLRVAMMKNPNAGKALSYIPKLASGNIKVNAQLVLCPEINDGPELIYSLDRLCELAPNVQSVAVVPVGLTKYRNGLPLLRSYTPAEALVIVETIERYSNDMLQQHGQRICYAADEFYLLSGREIPPAAFYEDFAQLENGVGLWSLLADEFRIAIEKIQPRPLCRTITIATGILAAPLIQSLATLAQTMFPGLQITVAPIQNDYFGRAITVAGLVTATDLIAQLSGRTLGDQLLIPSVMLRREGDMFLDSITLAQLQETLGLPVRAVPNDGFALLDAMTGC